MAENREITLFSEPEELIAWAEVYDKQINPSIEDAALLLNYMEGHDYAIGMDAEGKMYRQDMAEENGEIEPFPIDDVIDKVCEWNYDLILHAEAKKDDPKDFQEYCEFQKKYDSLKADERVLDRLFDKTSHAKEIDAVATALVEAFISNLEGKDYEEFLELLSEKGYQIKQGKHLAIKPQGMTRFRRCKSLGDMYCEEAIRDRIVKEDIAFYKSKQDIPKVSIVKCRVKRYRRAGLSGLQKKHYAKLYRVGKLKKRPYSQVWKYREDIRKMHKLQEQYLFLARHNIHSAEELVGTIASLTDKKKETSAEKSRIYKARERSMELFTAADEMENLKPAEQSYRLGDIFFEDEHRKWVALEQELQAQGYSLEEVQALRRHYKEEYSEVCAREKVVCRELNTGKAILNSMIPDSISDGRKTEYNREIIRDRKEQPVR